MTATINLQHKTILKYEGSRDGIFAWHEFKQYFEYDGNSTLREEILDNLALVPYSGKMPIADFIDQFQNHMLCSMPTVKTRRSARLQSTNK